MKEIIKTQQFHLSIKIIPVLFLLFFVILPAHAEEQQIKLTSDGTLKIGLSTDPANPNPGDQAQLKIDFINKQTNYVQHHIDYKVTIMKETNQVYGTSILHTAEGSITIPFQFTNAGIFQVIVEVDGILFQPIPPDTAQFTVTVGNSQSSQNGSSQQTDSTQSVVIPSWIKNNANWWSHGQVGDSDFVKGIQYMIQQRIMQIPAQQSSSAASGTQSIPLWIKNNAGWWAAGQISDNDFVKGIQWLVSNGIIKA
jgi:hypothetical protein